MLIHLIRMDGSAIAVKAIVSDVKMFYQWFFFFFFCLFTKSYSSGWEKKTGRCSISIQTEVISLCKGLVGYSNENCSNNLMKNNSQNIEIKYMITRTFFIQGFCSIKNKPLMTKEKSNCYQVQWNSKRKSFQVFTYRISIMLTFWLRASAGLLKLVTTELNWLFIHWKI